MCGIVGVFGPGAQTTDLDAALTCLAHRGPDHAAQHRGARATLGYRRLAIRAVRGADGQQPFSSAAVPDVVAFGVGEIYNSDRVLRDRRALGVTPVGDVGALLALYLTGGIQALGEAVGEFACAIHDGRTGELVLARDLVGTRGLFYAWQDDTLVFASETRALRALGLRMDPDPDAVAAYLRYGYPQAPGTFYAGVRQVPAGTAVVVRDGTTDVVSHTSLVDLARTAAAGRSTEVGRADVAAAVSVAVADRLCSDVPLGLHLSGGTDSSLVAHLAGPGVRDSFTVSYLEGEGGASSDLHWSAAVREQLGLAGDVVRLPARAALDRVPGVIDSLDGPVMSSGAVTTGIVAERARLRGVTVLVEGQGGDEVFLGYRRFADVLDGTADAATIASNTPLAPLAGVVDDDMAARVRDADARFRSDVLAVGVDSPLLAFQVAYMQHFLHELLRIEDHLHLARSVENRPPFLDRRVVEVGLALTAADPRAALGKPALRRHLADVGSVAAQRPVKGQMAVPDATVAAWAVAVLSDDVARATLGFADVPALLASVAGRPASHAQTRLLWAMANLHLWALRDGTTL